MNDFRYTVHLEVRIDGPEEDWDKVAERLRRSVRALHLKGGFNVADVGIDTARDVEDEA